MVASTVLNMESLIIKLTLRSWIIRLKNKKNTCNYISKSDSSKRNESIINGGDVIPSFKDDKDAGRKEDKEEESRHEVEKDLTQHAKIGEEVAQVIGPLLVSSLVLSID